MVTTISPYSTDLDNLIIKKLNELGKNIVNKHKKGRNNMDKKIKALTKDTKKLVKKEKSLLKEDKKHDKIIDKAKMKMKGKC